MDPFDLHLHRVPYGGPFDPSDADRARGSVLAMLQQRFVEAGRVDPTLIALTAEDMVVGEVAEPPAMGEEGKLVAAHLAMARMEGAVRAMRVGEALVGDPMRRTLVLCELDPDTGRWWLAWRAVGQGRGGVGVLRGDGWQIAAGTDPADAPEGLRDWLDPGGWTMTVPEPQWRDTALDLDVQCAFIPVAPDAAPGDHDALARWMEDGVVAHVEQAPSKVRVLVLRPAVFEHWVIDGTLPCGLDDLVRNLVAYGEEPARAAALVALAPITLDGEPARAMQILVERDGYRVERVRPLQVAEDGTVRLPISLGPRRHGPLPEGAQWLGVAPTHDLKVYLRSLPGGPIPDA